MWPDDTCARAAHPGSLSTAKCFHRSTHQTLSPPCSVQNPHSNASQNPHPSRGINAKPLPSMDGGAWM